MGIEFPSTSMALLPILILALAIISNTYSAVAATAAATERAPPELILLNLIGRDSDKASFAVQIHDLSLAGFANRTNHWHAFKGYEHIITNATLLPFTNSYNDLIGGLENLPNLPLGRDPVLDAIDSVSGHDPVAAVDADVEKALKRGLATLKVTKCEALRLKPIKDVVSDGWESGDAHLTLEHLGYIEHFDTICFELTRAKRSGVWDGPFTELLRSRANIHSLEDARAVVGVAVHRTFDQLLRAHARSA
ncbi:hypothetical protein HU200_065297 [Digitaria exilis]|uniref:rRNA N-glycosylase n=1 Tax=Digitaria exilis TaxID=1010633 RepID=A0A835DTU9_9POAL|nr:hypothetical protein HU200_065297 [Digitaria exilis]